MRWLSKKILHHRWIVMITFLVVTLVSAFLAGGVGINYNLADYLPEDSPSTVGLNVMYDAFETAVPNLRIMLKDVDVPTALAFKEQIAQAEGVQEVYWLDDTVNVNQPLETIDVKVLDSWYKDSNALFSVTVDSSRTKDTVDSLRELIGDKGVFAGDAVNISAAQETTGKEVGTVMLFIIPVILIILLITTSSWFEPILFLVSVGVAILINNGTNVMFGEISFITMATSSILQLAVSMDYSIFLLHRFGEYRAEGMDVQSAMAKAMEKSFSSILASALTTIIGFAALVFMRFQLGPDMGFVLAKGIIFSLVSVLFLLPVLTVLTCKLIDKTHHRSFLPSFKGFGKVAPKLFIPVLIIVALLFVPSYLGQRQNNFLYGASAVSSDENSPTLKEEQQIDALYGKSNLMVLLVPSDNLAAEQSLIDDLYRVDEITSITSYTETVGAAIPMEYVPDDALKQMISNGYSRMILTVNTAQESPEAFAVVETIRNLSQQYFPDKYYFVGGSANVYDMKETVTTDNRIVAIVSVLGIGLVILLVFRSLSIPFILLLAIQASIWINLSVPYFSGSSMAYIGYMIISSVQLGATVDYAILFANRYIENRHSLDKRKAISKTISDTTSSILTSAGILAAAGFILGIVSTNGVVGEFGILIGRGALLSAAMVLLFLPAILYFTDSVLPKTTLGLKFLKSPHKTAAPSEPEEMKEGQ